MPRFSQLWPSILAGAWIVHGAGADWPRFRGRQGSGVGESLAGRSFPTVFGPGTNVLWSVVPPPGHSSPCIAGDRIFLTGYAEGQLLTLAYDRATGRELWRRGLPAGKIERGASLGSPATATPCTDGERVCVYFGSFGLAAYGVDGSELWRHPLPVPVTQHGAGTSPVLAGDRLILNCDQDVGSFLLAVDKRTGKPLWRVSREEFHRGFSTPLPIPADRPDQVVVAGTLRLVSYNLLDGSERWTVRGLPNEMVSSPVESGGLVYVAGWTAGSGVARMPGWAGLVELGDADHDGRLSRDEAPPGPAKQHFPYIDADKDGIITKAEYETVARLFDESRNVAMAVRTDGRGDVTSTHLEWTATRGLPYVPSPLVYQGRVHLVRNGGLATCLDAKSGRAFYQEERVGALGDYYASPVASDGRICLLSQPGTAVILRAGETLEVLARNPLGEAALATPAIVDGVLYVRTLGHLHAFAEAGARAGPAAGNRTVAREILADPDLPRVLGMARALLKTGLTAGSGYGEVWIRDLNTFIEVALEVNDPRTIRTALQRFFQFQGTTGDIVDGYIAREKAAVGYKYRKSALAPEWLAHKNTVETDQEASLVQAVARYVKATGDVGFLGEVVAGKTVRDRLEWAIQYVLSERFDPEHGLVWGATTADWGDVQPEHAWGVELDGSSHRAIDIYDNAMVLQAIDAFIGLPGTAEPVAKAWGGRRDALKARIREHLWEAARRKFVPHLYLAGSPFPPELREADMHFHGGTAVAVEAGVLAPDEVTAVLAQMVANVRAAGASSIGLTIYPPYPEGTFANRSMGPYSYQNGGDWCWFGGRMIQALVRQGRGGEAWRELKPMVARVRQHGDFYEWWSRDNQPRGSSQYRGSAGVLGRAIELLLEWAKAEEGQ